MQEKVFMWTGLCGLLEAEDQRAQGALYGWRMQKDLQVHSPSVKILPTILIF